MRSKSIFELALRQQTKRQMSTIEKLNNVLKSIGGLTLSQTTIKEGDYTIFELKILNDSEGFKPIFSRKSKMRNKDIDRIHPDREEAIKELWNGKASAPLIIIIDYVIKGLEENE